MEARWLLIYTVPRNELVSYLRQAISEQRRIDANYASVEPIAGSSLFSTALSGPQRSGDVEIKLVLPPEPTSSKGRVQGKQVRKHRHTTKVSSHVHS